MQRIRTSLAIAGTYTAAAVVVLPFVYLVCASLKRSEDFFTSVFLPVGDGLFGVAWERLTLGNFTRLFTEFGFGGSLLNSVFYASVLSVVATGLCAMTGYALAKFEFAGRRAITLLVLGVLIIPGTLLLAPTYQLLYQLGLLETTLGLLLPLAAPAFGVYLFRQASLNGVPTELLEAARVDGCGEFRMFASIALPLVRPVTGAFLMITFLGMWNNFIWPQIVLQDDTRHPLSVAIAQLHSVYAQDYGLLMAAAVVSVLPAMALFLLLQRDFVAGLTRGAIKG